MGNVDAAWCQVPNGGESKHTVWGGMSPPQWIRGSGRRQKGGVKGADNSKYLGAMPPETEWRVPKAEGSIQK